MYWSFSFHLYENNYNNIISKKIVIIKFGPLPPPY